MKLGEVCESISQTFRRSLDEVVLINTSDVFDGKVTNHIYVQNENLRGQFKKSFRHNDILYSEIRPKNRRFAFVDFDSSDYIASTKLMVIRSNERVLPEFLFQVLKSDEVIDLLQSFAETRSGTFPQITFTELASIDVSIPTISEQRVIAATLRAYDDKIANNTKINHHLEQMAQAIYKSWFVDFEPFGGVMPDDWREGTIADTCSAIYNGGTPRRNEPLFWSNEVPWLTSGEVRQAIIAKTENFISEAGLSGSTAKWVPTLSTVIALYGATAGQVSMVALPLTTNQAICSLVPKENCTYYNYLCMRNAIRELENQAIGSAQQNISKCIVEETLCLIPDNKTLAEFESMASPFFFSWITNLEESNRLAQLRDTILPRLMSGELSVADI